MTQQSSSFQPSLGHLQSNFADRSSLVVDQLPSDKGVGVLVGAPLLSCEEMCDAIFRSGRIETQRLVGCVKNSQRLHVFILKIRAGSFRDRLRFTQNSRSLSCEAEFGAPALRLPRKILCHSGRELRKNSADLDEGKRTQPHQKAHNKDRKHDLQTDESLRPLLLVKRCRAPGLPAFGSTHLVFCPFPRGANEPTAGSSS